MKTSEKATHDSHQPKHKAEDDSERITMIIPFIVSSFLVLPTLVVFVLTKDTPGYDALETVGYFVLVKALLWLLVVISTLSATVFFIRARGLWPRIIVALILAAVVGSFTYLMQT